LVDTNALLPGVPQPIRKQAAARCASAQNKHQRDSLSSDRLCGLTHRRRGRIRKPCVFKRETQRRGQGATRPPLKREKRQLKADRSTLKNDKRSGRASADSKDAQKVSDDKQAIKGEKAAVATDRVNLKADEKN
jgi:hypothetical protein